MAKICCDVKASPTRPPILWSPQSPRWARMVPSHSMGPSLFRWSCRTKSTSVARRLQSCFCQSYNSSQTQFVITGVMWNSSNLLKDTCGSESQLRARQWCKLSQSPAAKVAFHVSRSRLSMRPAGYQRHSGFHLETRTTSSLSLFLISGAQLSLLGFFPHLAPLRRRKRAMVSRRMRSLSAKTFGKLGEQFEKSSQNPVAPWLGMLSLLSH